MACPLCGDRCTCSFATASELDAPISFADDLPSIDLNSGELVGASVRTANSPARVTLTQTATAEPEYYRAAPQPEWKNEVASRLKAHRARRRRNSGDDSLSLGFEEFNEPAAYTAPPQPQYSEPLADAILDETLPLVEPEQESVTRTLRAPKPADADNLIVFPRQTSFEEVFGDELAEPVLTHPRIVEVAEPHPVAVAQPVYAPVRLDDAEALEDPEPYQPTGLEMPLQVAAMTPRVTCAIVDLVMALCATAVFAVISVSFTQFVPQGKMLWASLSVLSLLFSCAYQYIFLVYAGQTPGMQVAQLELTSFEGLFPSRHTRAARAAATLLSEMALGLGYAWALVDEEMLAWHDRITRTYLRQG